MEARILNNSDQYLFHLPSFLVLCGCQPSASKVSFPLSSIFGRGRAKIYMRNPNMKKLPKKAFFLVAVFLLQ